MKLFRKSLAAIVCVIAVLGSGASAFAGVTSVEQLPKAYWALQDFYNAALQSGDNKGVITSGESIGALFVPGGDYTKTAAQLTANRDDLIVSITYPTLLNVAKAYEALGANYADIAEAYKNALPFAHAYRAFLENTRPNEDHMGMYYAVKYIESKIDKYDVNIDVYVKTNEFSSVYHGARFEPKSGVYYGEAHSLKQDLSRSNDFLTSLDKKTSGALMYVTYETEPVTSFSWLLERMAAEHDIIEVAWNVKYENASLKQVLNDGAKIDEALKYLSGLNTKVLLRFGAEMNVWTKLADSADFIAAYRFIADKAHKYANIAMLWSPNAISAEGATYEQYYPGDAYVDWVGISHYTMKYFLGKKNQTDEEQAIYGTGNYANPLLMAKEIVEKYGAKKPVALSECGVENYSVTNKESTDDWAENLLRALYAYLPAVYPEIKAVFYFDQFNEGLSAARFSLHTNDRMNKLYAKLTESSYFLAKGKTNSGVSFRKTDGGVVKQNADNVGLMVYAPIYDLGPLNVTYSLNNEVFAAASVIPYERTFDFSNYADGIYKVTVNVGSGGRTLATTTLNMKKIKGSVLLSKSDLTNAQSEPDIEVNGQRLAFPANAKPTTLDGVMYAPVTQLANAIGKMPPDSVKRITLNGVYYVSVSDVCQTFKLNRVWDANTNTTKITN